MSDATSHPQTPATGPSPRLTAIIVAYKSAPTLPAALASALRCAQAGLMETIVVDNATPDQATRDVIARNAAPFARVLRNHTNVGFGRGCNVGLAAARTPYVIFFNPDAEMEPQACETLVRFMDEHPRCALAGPAIAHEGKEGFQHVGGLMRPTDIVGDCLGRYSSLRRRQRVEAGAAPFRTDWVSGAMLLGRTDVLRGLGGFDPRYFLYWEETDLCRRALRAGHEVWAVPTAQVRHVGGVSAAQESDDRVRGCIATHYYQSRQHYLRTHFGTPAALAAELAEFALMPAHEGLRALLRRHHQPVLRRWKHPLWQLPKPPTQIGGDIGILPPFAPSADGARA